MVVHIYQNIGHGILLVLLLCCSAFFSGSETAFFNLSRRQIRLLQESKHRLQVLVVRLLHRPGQLLNCLLFGNMCVNVLYYAVSSVFVIKISQQRGFSAATIFAAITFALLVIFGEILPKSIAYANSKALSIMASLPVFLCLQIFAPIGFVFKFFILEPFLRIVLGPERAPQAVSVNEFKMLIETSRREGLITADETRLLEEVVELGFLKVRHVMQPRVDMLACAVTESPEKVRRIIQKSNITKIPVYVHTIDNIVGLVHLRQLLLKPNVSLDQLVQPVHFVPEQKSIESLLEFFRKTQTDVAIVVDEYGGIAGSVRLEDIAKELFGIEEVTGVDEPIKQIGPFQYRLSGNLAIHEWVDVFGIDLAETRLSTIGGLVATLLGKIPKSGDVAYFKNLKFTVEDVRKNRIQTVVLSLEPIPAND